MESENSTKEILIWNFDGKTGYPEHKYQKPGIYRVGTPPNNRKK